MKCKSDPSFLQLLIEKSQTDGKNEKKNKKKKKLKKKPERLLIFTLEWRKTKYLKKQIFSLNIPLKIAGFA